MDIKYQLPLAIKKEEFDENRVVIVQPKNKKDTSVICYKYNNDIIKKLVVMTDWIDYNIDCGSKHIRFRADYFKDILQKLANNENLKKIHSDNIIVSDNVSSNDLSEFTLHLPKSKGGGKDKIIGIKIEEEQVRQLIYNYITQGKFIVYFNVYKSRVYPIVICAELKHKSRNVYSDISKNTAQIEIEENIVM